MQLHVKGFPEDQEDMLKAARVSYTGIGSDLGDGWGGEGIRLYLIFGSCTLRLALSKCIQQFCNRKATVMISLHRRAGYFVHFGA